MLFIIAEDVSFEKRRRKPKENNLKIPEFN